ncbi:POZ domain-containing protein [Exidia glandulosa HHB12029]|uniref:Elongin-C n=1 Tax=Exidia glandulosa HHB12029 TaxID=1314781 RepID=A0A165NQU0_EXIGL|nr:POZ domain-containing protein [Exidia glandulosa HHB12029]
MAEQDEWVKLVSLDGFEFLLPRAAAQGSNTLKDMLDMSIGLAEATSNTVKLEYRAAVLQIVCEYLMYRYQVNTSGSKDEVPDFLERIPPELSLEVLMASDFLQA